ncbi:MAG: HK97 family phage prohead protease [Saprospiraceae bacterium]|nr:HK97 family phage prohead protease [Saprospiraceae bacterium]
MEALKVTNNIERRVAQAPVMRMKDDDKARRVVGYAATFNSDSEALWGSFIEQVDARAFDEADMSDVRALFNHDDNKILARTPGTLSLEVDEMGLRYEFDMPDTSYGNDLLISMERGDISQSSFGFTVTDEEWIDRSADKLLPLRRILKVGRLFDVSPVTYPAYPETTSEVRSRFGGEIPEIPENLNNENRTDLIDKQIDAYSEILLTYKGLALDVKRG